MSITPSEADHRRGEWVCPRRRHRTGAGQRLGHRGRHCRVRSAGGAPWSGGLRRRCVPPGTADSSQDRLGDGVHRRADLRPAGLRTGADNPGGTAGSGAFRGTRTGRSHRGQRTAGGAGHQTDRGRNHQRICSARSARLGAQSCRGGPACGARKTRRRESGHSSRNGNRIGQDDETKTRPFAVTGHRGSRNDRAGKVYGKSSSEFAAQAHASPWPTPGCDCRMSMACSCRRAWPTMSASACRSTSSCGTSQRLTQMQAFGSTAGAMVQVASMAVEAGMAQVVVCVFGDAPLQGGNRGGQRLFGRAPYARPDGPDYSARRVR